MCAPLIGSGRRSRAWRPGRARSRRRHYCARRSICGAAVAGRMAASAACSVASGRAASTIAPGCTVAVATRPLRQGAVGARACTLARPGRRPAACPAPAAPGQRPAPAAAVPQPNQRRRACCQPQRTRLWLSRVPSNTPNGPHGQQTGSIQVKVNTPPPVPAMWCHHPAGAGSKNSCRTLTPARGGQQHGGNGRHTTTWCQGLWKLAQHGG